MSNENFFSIPRLITGPPGCGKSHFIRKLAEEEKKQLLHWSCRKDRTLRDGRQILHTWAKRSENAVIWLEGADDLTQESQAFLRRISETHSPLVSFVLECRDGSKLQDPIRSRYSIWNLERPSWIDLEICFPEIRIHNLKKYIPDYELSYRRILSILNLINNHPKEWDKFINTYEIEKTQDIYTIKELQFNAVNPINIIKKSISQISTEASADKQFKLNNIKIYSDFLFNSGNPWAFLAYLRSIKN